MSSCDNIPDVVADSRYHFIGDSLIARWNLASSFPMLITYNHGLSGSGLTYLQENPNIAKGQTAIVLSGTNNLYGLYTDEDIDGFADKFVTAAINLGGKRTYIISLIPRYFIEESFEVSLELTDRATRLNNAIKEKIESVSRNYEDTGKVIAFVDVFPYLTGPSDQIINWQYYNDGLHLSPEGYRLITHYLNKYILN